MFCPITNAGALPYKVDQIIKHFEDLCNEHKSLYGGSDFLIEDGGVSSFTLPEYQEKVIVISTKLMRCNGRSLGFCGSGGCTEHVVVQNHVYDIFGSTPKLIVYNQPLIGWWVSCYACDVEDDRTISNSTDCLIVSVWDDYAKRLRYPQKRKSDSIFNDKLKN